MTTFHESPRPSYDRSACPSVQHLFESKRGSDRLACGHARCSEASVGDVVRLRSRSSPTRSFGKVRDKGGLYLHMVMLLVLMVLPLHRAGCAIAPVNGHVDIPTTWKSIDYQAFYQCSSLASVTIGDSVTSIDYQAFYKCSSLASVTIPDSVTSIGSDAFRGCSSLASVTIGDSVTSIGSSAFLRCSSLASVTIGDSVTSIGGSAFYGCSSLASVTIPDSVTSIDRAAFYECSSLRSVVLGSRLNEIGPRTFGYTNALRSVYIRNSAFSYPIVAFGDLGSIRFFFTKSATSIIDQQGYVSCVENVCACIPGHGAIGGDTSTSEYFSCQPCTSGSYNSKLDRECTLCSGGTYMPLHFEGAESEKDCLVCEAGKLPS